MVPKLWVGETLVLELFFFCWVVSELFKMVQNSPYCRRPSKIRQFYVRLLKYPSIWREKKKCLYRVFYFPFFFFFFFFYQKAIPISKITKLFLLQRVTFECLWTSGLIEGLGKGWQWWRFGSRSLRLKSFGEIGTHVFNQNMKITKLGKSDQIEEVIKVFSHMTQKNTVTRDLGFLHK